MYCDQLVHPNSTKSRIGAHALNMAIIQDKRSSETGRKPFCNVFIRQARQFMSNSSKTLRLKIAPRESTFSTLRLLTCVTGFFFSGFRPRLQCASRKKRERMSVSHSFFPPDLFDDKTLKSKRLK